jgi:formyltetrahydrofolate-dependent phosphoribosylglycinamide formyltransferase
MQFCSMLNKLKQHWNVNGWNLLLIISTFALGGSLCGYAGRKVLIMAGIEKGALWIVLYIVVLTLLWPLCVLLVSIPLGQFPFFKRYIGKILGKLGPKKLNSHSQPSTIRLAIFASGAGSNALNIINYFKKVPHIKVELIVCNNPKAGVITIAKNNHISLLMIDKESLNNSGECLEVLNKWKIDLIVLAGFLWKLPPSIIHAFPKKIINIHPSLLPAYGGKGFYGTKVHEAVIANREKQSGISIHLADELYDHGEILFQANCTIDPNETAQTLAQKIHQLEQAHFPKVIENYLQKQNQR